MRPWSLSQIGGQTDSRIYERNGGIRLTRVD